MRLHELSITLMTTLKAHAGLIALLSVDPIDGTSPAIYDHVPQNVTFPYLILGEPNGAEHDADDIQGWTGVVIIHVWSEFRGFQEVNIIMRQIDAALHRQTPAITDARIVTLHRESVDSLVDDDGLRRHGMHGFRVILEEL